MTGLPPASRALWRAASPTTDAVRPLISILVWAGRHARALERLLRSFASVNSYPAVEIRLIVDQGAEDVLAAATAWSARVPIAVTQRPARASEARALNAAARDAAGEHLLLLDVGVVFKDDVLADLVNALADPAVGAVGVKQYGGPPISMRPPGPAAIGVRLNWDKAFLRPGAATPTEVDGLLADSPASFMGATDAMILCRRAEYLAVGGLEEGYADGRHGFDLCCKIRRRLNKLVICMNNLGVWKERLGAAGSAPPAAARAASKQSRALFRRRWGYALRREWRALLPADDGSTLGRRRTVGLAVTSVDLNRGSGDAYTAWGLGEAMRRRGWAVRYLPRGEWTDAAGLDVYVAMRDDIDIRALKNAYPHLTTVAWMRNWLERWVEHPWFERFSLHLCSSERGRDYVWAQRRVRAELFPIAVAAERFGEGPPRPGYPFDYVFTGNRWPEAPPREVERLEPGGLPYRFGVFGQGWEDHPVFGPYAMGFVPYEDLVEIYNSAPITIDDAVAHVTKPWGSLNGRVFEALAAGSLPLTNNVAGAAESFGGALPVWDGPEDLARQVRRYLEAPREREALVSRLRAEVLAKHTYAHRAERLQALLQTRAEALHIAIKCPVPNWDEREAWGDHHFARALKKALERRGYCVRLDILPDWAGPAAAADDAVIVLRGLSRYEPAPDQINICWLISHPEAVGDEELNRYDHVFVASERFAAELAQRLSTPVSALLQCSDPDVFRPATEAGGGAEEPVLFVGNSRKRKRKVVTDAAAAGLPFALYGRDWEGLAPGGVLKGEYVPNGSLHRYYGAAKIVLNDHWPDMAAKGFVSNRIFDAGLSEAFVISAAFQGAELFEGSIVTYQTVDELKRAADRWLADDVGRRQRARKLRELVLAAHTFDHRAAAITEVVERLHERRARGPADAPPA